MGNCHLFVKATLNGCAAATDDKKEKKETGLFGEPSVPSASQVIIEAFPQKKKRTLIRMLFIKHAVMLLSIWMAWLHYFGH